MIGSDGSGETALTNSGEIWSIVISPNGEKLAFTSIYVDTTIYIMDLTDTTGASDQAWKINRIAGLEGSTAWMLYADALDWKKDSETILYDAVNMKVINLQDTTYYWSIYNMRASDGSAWQIFPSQSEEVSVGNPVYASNNDYIIAFDHINASGNVYIMGANLETGDIGVITYNYSSLGFPSFSNNDSKVIYQYYDWYQDLYTLWVVGLQSDKINGVDNDYPFAYDAKSPVWFAIGHRPADVEEPEENQKLPSAFTLEQNYPNPFNPETRIKYTVGSRQTHSIPTTLKVYNILGQLVRTLVDAPQEPGTHEVIWDGKDEKGNEVASGVYLYQLKTADFRQTRKMVLIR